MFKSVSHCFGVSDTIMGAIRKYNAADIDKVTRELLLKEFARLNGEGIVPRPGMTMLIPIRTF
ncbi:hypothetical protein D3C81_1839050 [compost metagenome]